MQKKKAKKHSKSLRIQSVPDEAQVIGNCIAVLIFKGWVGDTQERTSASFQARKLLENALDTRPSMPHHCSSIRNLPLRDDVTHWLNQHGVTTIRQLLALSRQDVAVMLPDCVEEIEQAKADYVLKTSVIFETTHYLHSTG